MGMMPYSAPSRVALIVCSGGIRHTRTASRIDRARPISAAFHALTRKTPSSTNSVARGMTATSADRARDPKTGSRICWNNLVTPLGIESAAGDEPSGSPHSLRQLPHCQTSRPTVKHSCMSTSRLNWNGGAAA